MIKSLKATVKSPVKTKTNGGNGLYHKALFYVKKLPSVRTDSGINRFSGGSMDGITEEEKREIIHEIDTLIAQKKTRITPDLLAYKPQHLGILLPFLINLAAAGIVITAFFLLPFLFEKGFFERIERRTQTVLSTESDILEKYKQESAARISEKEAELNSIQGKMSQLQKEKELLDASFEDEIRKKEEELKKSLQNTLEKERNKLLSQGITQETMQAELQKLELQLRQTNTQALASYKNEMQGELSRKEELITELGQQLASGQQALTRIQEEFQAQITARENELKSKEEELKKREAALQASSRAEKQQLESALGEVSDQFTRLQNQQQQEQLVHNQLLSLYNLLAASLSKQNYAEAAGNLKTLEAFLTKNEHAGLTLIQERKQVELFVIASLKDYIALKQTGGKQKQEAENGLVASIVATVREAQQAYRQNDKQKAYKLYTAALEKIPEIKTSYQALQAENEALYKSEMEKLAAQLTDLKKKQTELEQQALAMTNELSRFKSASEAQLPAETKRRQLSERLLSMKQQFLVYLDKNKTSQTSQPADDYYLIEAKLILKNILTSPAVSSQYPELYQDMERYFNYLNELRSNWQAVTLGLLTVLKYLNGEFTLKHFTSVWPAYQQESQQDLMRRFLTNLEVTCQLIQEPQVKKLQALAADLNAYFKAHKTGAPLSESEMYNLVMAKLVVKKILATEPYAAEYPELYRNLERYIALQEQEQTVWQTCFQELVYLASRLNEELKTAELATHWPAFRAQEQKELLLNFINTLQALL